ncbi:MAG: matrixin family metalloprotease [Acidobacteria bacterium]|nr:matrixin family metalloprotease [Acidobacteriota bacterium]
MRRALSTLCLSAFILAASVPSARAYTHQHTATSARLHWAAQTIHITLSTSLQNPPGNIAPGSDAAGAARRALRRWSDATNINFTTEIAAVNATSADGRNVITVTPSDPAFVTGERPGRARVQFNPADGAIFEADMAVNPSLPFSTTGAHDTYDLESTFVHEIGHMLGLDHSGLEGASMQPRQTRNFNAQGVSFPQTTVRTLSDDDLAAVRALYGRRQPQPAGRVEGTVSNGAVGAHVWAEDVGTGRVAGAAVTQVGGVYRIEGLPPGQYRLNVERLDGPVNAGEITAPTGPHTALTTGSYQTTEGPTVTVSDGAATPAVLLVNPAAPALNPRSLGVDSIPAAFAAPIPLAAGRTYRIYVGGEGLENVPAAGVSATTPFMSIDPASFARESPVGGLSSLVSFNLTVHDTAKVGDYSVRLQSASGEVAYVSGGLTVDPYTAGFFRSPEFELKGLSVYRFYKVAFGRQPLYGEIIPDMRFVTGATEAELFARRDAFAAGFVGRPEFRATAALSPADYVNTLMNRYGALQQITTPDPAAPNGSAKVTLTRSDLINRLTAGTLGRAQVLRAIAESDQVTAAEFRPGFVAMQYFGYLKRDAEPSGFNAWLSYLNANPTDFYTMVNGFMNAREYRTRFGQP